MKSFKITFLSLMSLLLVTPSFAQTTQRTLVKSFNVNNVQSVILNLDGDVEIRKWKKGLMRVEMKISLENGNDRLLKSMVIANRFNLDSEISEGQMTVFAPALENQITIRGKEITEKISYIINIPEEINANVLEIETLSLVEEKEK